MVPSVCIAVSDASQVGEVRREAARMADRAKLEPTAQGAVALAATELATNLSRYASSGRMFVQRVALDGRDYIELVATDGGPGMADVDQCVRDGYSTGGTSGTGLGAVKRLSAEFDIYSIPGRGTSVLTRIGPRGHRAPPSRFRWGGLGTAAPLETVSGDAWEVAERDGAIALMIADGLGHGVVAAEASTRAAEVFAAHAFAGPVTFCERTHEALAGTRGAAVALAHVSADLVLTYAGVGNISGSIVSPERSRGLLSQNGTAGFQMRTVKSVTQPWPEYGCLVMHSDGLTSRWSLADYPGLLRRHPMLIASTLYRDCVRGRDDATVVVIGEAPRV